MRYVKADEIFPEELLMEIKKYVQGEMIYIPKDDTNRKKWGERTGTRDYLEQRNAQICDKFSRGNTMDELSEEFFLSVYSIKRIVYSKKKLCTARH